MSYSSIVGQYEANLNAQAGTDRVATDKDTFLKLLVAQLTHQDPLNPVEDKEFISQLAQFTQVEELQKINTGVEDLNSAYLQSQTTNAATLIGTMVLAGGDNLTLSGASEFTSEDDYPSIYYTLPYDSTEGTVTVWSTDAQGNPASPVYSASMPGRTAGRYEIKWHGQNYNGSACADGTYIVNVTAVDTDGKNMVVDTSSRGVVMGVETKSDGNHTLHLHDGRTVNFNNVDLILGVYGDSSGDGTGTDDGTGDGSGENSGDNPGSDPDTDTGETENNG